MFGVRREARVSLRNTGKGFESMVLATAEVYEAEGVLTLCKVDPPTQVVWSRNKPKVIFKKGNPFLDFVGSWTERGGCALFLEAKSTKDDRLDIYAQGGVTVAQVQSLLRWEKAGAAVGVLWERHGEIRFLSLLTIRKNRQLGRSSVGWNCAEIVPQGMGFKIADFVVNLRKAYP
jgi:penicillin-binding protein-related factor A (putative recombinase)